MLTDSTSIESTLTQVSDIWRPHLRTEASEELREMKVLRVLDRPYSTTRILEAITDRGTKQVVLKQIAEHPLNASVVDDPAQAAVEFGVLSKLHPRYLDVDRCSVPRPLLLLPEFNAYLMDFVEGHVVADRLNYLHYFANRREFGQLQRHFYDIGRWLAHFHKVTELRLADATAVDNVVARCHHRLQVIEEARHPGCPPDFHGLATRYINQLLEQLSGFEILTTGRHGDFGPWNVLGGAGGVTVIDFFGYREDPLPVDILSMLVFLESQQYGLANSVWRIRTLCEQFLAGLGALPPLPEPLILLCEAQQRILQIAGGVLGDHQGIFNRWERRRSLHHNVAWFRSYRERSTLWPR